MQIEDKLKTLLDKVNTGTINTSLTLLEGTDFGLYLPMYADGNEVKKMLEGYSQTEKDLVISISKNEESLPSDTKAVGWFGNLEGKDSQCKHGGTKSCKHCTTHTLDCKHCTGHPIPTASHIGDLDAPELNYNDSIEQLTNFGGLLEELANDGIGISLLHGHNSSHEFTKLPEGIVSVISNDTTNFRSIEEVNRLHEKALYLGSVSEGEPRIRSNMHSAYVRDLDNNKVCFYTSNA